MSRILKYTGILIMGLGLSIAHINGGWASWLGAVIAVIGTMIMGLGIYDSKHYEDN